MRISFRERGLADLCNDDRLLQRTFGLKGDRIGEFSVRVHDGYRIIFTPDHAPVPVKPDGGVNWAAVTAIQIQSIEDYHD